MKTKYRYTKLCTLIFTVLLMAGCLPGERGDNGNPAGLSIDFTNPQGATAIQTPDIVVNIAGTVAGDHKIEIVEWQNDRGGKGKANGTEKFVTGNIVLQLGTNNITISAQDINGTEISKSLTIERENTALAADTPPNEPTVLMYSYSGKHTNAAPVQNASIKRQPTFIFVQPGTEWINKGIKSIRIACCKGLSGPGEGQDFGTRIDVTSPWSHQFDMTGLESGGTRRVTYEATFLDGSKSSVSAVDFVVAETAAATSNTAPLISGRPAKTATAGIKYSFRPSAEDPDGDTMNFSISGKPTWASFSKTTGRLYGTPTANHVRRYDNIVISVSDGQTSSSLPAFSIEVEAVSNGGATLTWSIPTERTDNSPLNNDLAGFYIYYGQSSGDYANKIKISNSSISNYMVDNLTSGRWFFTVTAFDTDGRESNPSNEGSKSF